MQYDSYVQVVHTAVCNFRGLTLLQAVRENIMNPISWFSFSSQGLYTDMVKFIFSLDK
jgi:hypothetical protein